MMCALNTAIAYSRARGQTLLKAKLDITKAFDATNLDKETHTGAPMDKTPHLRQRLGRQLLGEQRHRESPLRQPPNHNGYSERWQVKSCVFTVSKAKHGKSSCDDAPNKC